MDRPGYTPRIGHRVAARRRLRSVAGTSDKHPTPRCPAGRLPVGRATAVAHLCFDLLSARCRPNFLLNFLF